MGKPCGDEAATLLRSKQKDAHLVADQIAHDSAAAERATSEANALFEAALPDLEAAKDALDSCGENELLDLAKAEDLPEAVAVIVACVCALRPLGNAHEGDSQLQALQTLSNPGLRQAILAYDKDAVGAEQIERVRALLAESGATVTSDACLLPKAARVLFTWVQSVIRYFDVSRAAAPK